MSTESTLGSWHVFGRLLQVTKRYAGLLVVGVVGTITVPLIDAGLTWLLKPLMNRGLIARDAHFLSWLPLILILAFLFRGLATFVSSYFINLTSRNIVMHFREKLFSQYIGMATAYYDKTNSGVMISSLIYNVERVAAATSDTLLIILRESAYLIGLLVVMMMVSWKLTLFFLLVVPLIAGMVKWTSKRMQHYSAVVQTSMADITTIADQGIRGHQVIKLACSQRREKKRFFAALRHNRHQQMKCIVTGAVGAGFVQIILGLPIASIMYVVTLPSMHVSPGTFTVIVTAMVSVLRPFRRLSTINQAIQEGITASRSVFAILDAESESNTGTYTPDLVRGELQFDQLNFRYETSERDVLSEFSLSISPGETVAVVGRSGSGKTTLAQLVPRFYTPTAGRILLDGVDLADYELSSLRHHIAYVSQQTVLFDDTIANNIRYVLDGEVSEERLIAAAKKAYAWEFIEALPDGIHTRIGQDGVLLSGGQRQRIAIARAIISNAPILILDEATSALDTESEQHIQKALDELMVGRTTIVIAHRLTTIENADRIVVMEAGRLVEQGAHAALLAQQGAYANLHSRQFKTGREQEAAGALA